MSSSKSEYESDATPEEIARAEELRAALEDANRAINDENADFARALAAAHANVDLQLAENDALLARAFATADARGAIPLIVHRRRNAARIAAMSASALALAAGVAIVLGQSSSSPVAAASGPFERSSEPLFASAADVQSSLGSGRIDRIARVRETEFFEAQLDTWGAR